jgi:magnesium chelatase subunit D
MNTLDDAALAASLFAVDPAGSGGVCIRSSVHPARDQWLQVLRDLLPAHTRLRRIPFNITDGRLLGGLDLAASIRAGKPITELGVLAAMDGGVLVVSMAERLTSHTAACINFVLDAGEVVLPRAGAIMRHRARVGIIALDEGMSEEEFVPASLLDRMAFLLDFSGMSTRALIAPAHDTEQILAARSLLPQVQCDLQTLSALCATAMVLGIESPRVSMLAVRAARAAAALDGRLELREEDAVLAGRLVLAPRATVAQSTQPQRSSDDRSEKPTDRPSEGDSGESRERSAELNQQEMDDLVLAAAQAAIPSGLLARLRAAPARRFTRSVGAGRVGVLRNAGARGRPYGVRSGAPRGNARLNVIETLRAAAPWQRMRGREGHHDSQVRIRKEDFRVTRYRQRTQTLTIFAVDASGSSALHRLAEAKGAVELLLAECYIRRDLVAVIAFRGRAAEVLLPPTRSLVRAKRSLAGLAGGGGTPLAAAIEVAAKLANQAERRGETPTIVMLTDGRANVLRNGTGAREAAQAEALRAAGGVRASKISALFIDTSPRPNALAKDLARMMNAQYIPLPFADARMLSNIVQTTTAAAHHSAAKP